MEKAPGMDTMWNEIKHNSDDIKDVKNSVDKVDSKIEKVDSKVDNAVNAIHSIEGKVSDIIHRFEERFQKAVKKNIRDGVTPLVTKEEHKAVVGRVRNLEKFMWVIIGLAITAVFGLMWAAATSALKEDIPTSPNSTETRAHLLSQTS